MNVRPFLAGLTAIVLAASATAAQEAKYHRDLPAKLVTEAKITEPAAAAIALKAVPNGTIDKMELEKEDGKFIYSYDIKVAGKSGVQEVHVDAMTGALVSNIHETPADEKAEKAKEATEGTSAKPAPKKPPTPGGR
ncbi:MAG TPA: PepSY domain-containing protein [Gemmatimonadaceae bacterium]